MVDAKARELWRQNDVVGLFRYLGPMALKTCMECLDDLIDFQTLGFYPNPIRYQAELRAAGINVPRMEVAMGAVMQKHGRSITWEKLQEIYATQLKTLSDQERDDVEDYWFAGPAPGLGSAPASKAHDLILYFTGNNHFSGQRLTPNDGKTDDDIINELSRLKGKNRIRLAGWGGMGGGKRMEEASRYITENSPRDKLIVYGYSAGGVDAIRLSRELWKPNPNDSSGRIDLLVTVDPATGSGNSMPREFTYLLSNVKVNVNFWTSQTTLGGDSHGEKLFAMDPNSTRLIDRPMPDEDHATIRLRSKDQCIDAIRKVVNG
jgi:hypothetical protein